MQLHPTSLPGGRLGRDAYAWVDWLADAGQSWWQMLPLGPPDRYGSPYKARSAFAAWPGLLAEPRAHRSRSAEELDFREREAGWIEDWARFAGRGAVADQVRFEREWSALRAYANERGVRLIGDVPIYVAPGSADHRAHPELFRDDAVAGTPPDAYTDKGQLWGNPLYDWPALQRRGYRWWIDAARAHVRALRPRADRPLPRLRLLLGGARGRPPRAERALAARARARAVRRAPARALGALPIIAEDLGVITPAGRAAARRARAARAWSCSSSAGCRAAPRNVHDVANHREHRIAYTGTHDNDTLRGWYESLPATRRRAVDATRPHAAAEVWWDLIALTFSSRARVAMVQAQDVLGLGSEARMNQPGGTAGAWRWRLDALPSAELASGCARRPRRPAGRT